MYIYPKWGKLCHSYRFKCSKYACCRILQLANDSYITEDYAKTAIEAEKDAVKEMEEVSRPRDWREEFADYKKQHPEMNVDEMIDSFDDYYNGLWDKYKEQNVNREIRTRGR